MIIFFDDTLSPEELEQDDVEYSEYIEGEEEDEDKRV